MQLIQVLSFASLLLMGVTATPLAAGDVSPNGTPASLPKDAIPVGAQVFGLDGEPEPVPSSLSMFTKRDDCNGSGNCGSTSGGSCTTASNTYNDNAWYCGYTSRVSSHCTAIFTCGNYHNTCWAGWFLKQSFREIYTTVGCGICGSRYFDGGNCRATYNYCSNCRNVG